MANGALKSSKKAVSDKEKMSVVSKKYEDRVIMGGKDNIEKFPVKLSSKAVYAINKTRKLPEGYLLQYTPKTISYEYYEGTYMKNTVVPPTYNIIKTDKSIEEFENTTVTDVIPFGYKVMNTQKATYITALRETEESLSRKVENKDFMASAKRLLSYIFG